MPNILCFFFSQECDCFTKLDLSRDHTILRNAEGLISISLDLAFKLYLQYLFAHQVRCYQTTSHRSTLSPWKPPNHWKNLQKPTNNCMNFGIRPKDAQKKRIFLLGLAWEKQKDSIYSLWFPNFHKPNNFTQLQVTGMSLMQPLGMHTPEPMNRSVKFLPMKASIPSHLCASRTSSQSLSQCPSIQFCNTQPMTISEGVKPKRLMQEFIECI